MKKKIIKSVLIGVCLIGGILFSFSTSKTESLSDITFQNIEALAGNEGNGENITCFGLGDVECHGYKVELKITGLSLEVE